MAYRPDLPAQRNIRVHLWSKFRILCHSVCGCQWSSIRIDWNNFCGLDSQLESHGESRENVDEFNIFHPHLTVDWLTPRCGQFQSLGRVHDGLVVQYRPSSHRILFQVGLSTEKGAGNYLHSHYHCAILRPSIRLLSAKFRVILQLVQILVVSAGGGFMFAYSYN